MSALDLVKRLRAVVPYQGKSNVAFLCHEAADALAAETKRADDNAAEIARLNRVLAIQSRAPTADEMQWAVAKLSGAVPTDGGEG